MKSVGVAEAKAKLSELMSEVAYGGQRIIVERRGKPMVAIVPVSDLSRVEDRPSGHWLDRALGLCADAPDFCDVLEEIVAERHKEVPREITFEWEEDDDPPRQ